jgi:hypothetical protein
MTSTTSTTPRIAKASDFKFGALLRTNNGTHVRVLNSPREHEFDAVYEGCAAEMVVDSRNANSFTLLEDGSNFKPSKEYLDLVRSYN